ncbi:hypothetical protein K2Y11_12520 [bacterium]|nr:hypothetical protein [bacterium]
MIQISLFALRIRAALALALSYAYSLLVILPFLPHLRWEERILIIPPVYTTAIFALSVYCLVQSIQSTLIRQLLAGLFEGSLILAAVVLFYYFKEDPSVRTDGEFHWTTLYVGVASFALKFTAIVVVNRTLIYRFQSLSRTTK